MFINVFWPDTIGTRYKCREEPVDEKITKQKFIAGHMPKKNRLPFFDWAAALRQHDERAIAIVWIEPSAQNKYEIPQTGSGTSADEILASQAFEVFFLGRFKIPSSKNGVSLIDHC